RHAFAVGSFDGNGRLVGHDRSLGIGSFRILAGHGVHAVNGSFESVFVLIAGVNRGELDLGSADVFDASAFTDVDSAAGSAAHGGGSNLFLSRLGHGAAFVDGFGNLRDHQLHGTDGVVVARNGVIDFFGIAVGIDNSHNRDFQTMGFLNGDVFLLAVNDEDAVRQTRHGADTAQNGVELTALFHELRHFF